MVSVRRRRGSSLLELMVALPLLLLLAALAVQGFVTQLRLVTRHEARLANVQELEHAVLALAADIRPLSARDVESWSDSAVVAHVPVLTGYVCGTPAPHLIDVAMGATGSAARTVTLADPRAGDVLGWGGLDSAIVGVESAVLDTAHHRGALASASRSASACADSPIRGTASPWRLALAVAPATLPQRGAPVTVARRTEWRSYRASDALHYLGRREWNGVAWSTIQPVAGPLQEPARAGMTLQMLRADGGVASATLGDARQLDLILRARRGSTIIDSLHVRLPLHGSGF